MLRKWLQKSNISASLVVGIATLAGTVVSGCAHDKNNSAQKAPASSAAGAETPAPASTPAEVTDSSLLQNEAGVHAVQTALQPIYFDFNKYEIRANQRDTAHAMAVALKANAEVNVRIEGNTDDRGSVEYNLALGQRRADALKSYFVLYGVSANQLTTVSYGKEKPAKEGSGEGVWAENRRDNVAIVH